MEVFYIAFVVIVPYFNSILMMNKSMRAIYYDEEERIDQSSDKGETFKKVKPLKFRMCDALTIKWTSNEDKLTKQ